MSICFPWGQRFSHPVKQPRTNRTFLLVPTRGEGGLTLQSVAVCCSQMVSSSMSSTWKEGMQGRCEAMAGPLKHLGVPYPGWGARV